MTWYFYVSWIELLKGTHISKDWLKEYKEYEAKFKKV